MALPAVVTNGVQVRLISTLAGGAALHINVLHAIRSGSTVINQDLANILGAALKTSWTTNIAPFAASGTSLEAVGVRDISSSNNAEFLDSGGIVSGTGVGDALPGSVALAVTLRTASTGQRYRGRNFIGGFTETENTTAAQASGALIVAVGNFFVSMKTEFTNNGLTMAVFSRPAEATQTRVTTIHSDGTTSIKDTSTKARAAALSPVTLVQVRNAVWDSQRRRGAAGSGGTLFARPLYSEQEGWTNPA